jgi:hypothetical protein
MWRQLWPRETLKLASLRLETGRRDATRCDCRSQHGVREPASVTKLLILDVLRVDPPVLCACLSCVFKLSVRGAARRLKRHVVSAKFKSHLPDTPWRCVLVFVISVRMSCCLYTYLVCYISLTNSVLHYASRFLYNPWKQWPNSWTHARSSRQSRLLRACLQPKKFRKFNVSMLNSVSGLLHRVGVGDGADVSEVYVTILRD